jgi:2-hydroxycyclohexanecarboxyl-CoA dehydrogenase
MRLEGKVALVTGGARGIGRAIAERLAREGAAVAILDVDRDGAEEAAAAIRESGANAIAVAADLTSYDETRAAFAAADRLGPIDVLVNNAGWDKIALFAESPPELWYRVIDINLKGPIHATRAALDRMIPRKTGRIVSIASDAGRVGSTGEAVYSGCKAGVIGFSKTIAREVARHGITANVLCPGPTQTRLLDEVRQGERGEKIIAAMTRAIPLGRLGEPQDLAGAVLFFASDDAAFVTGQVLSVSGGLTMAG